MIFRKIFSPVIVLILVLALSSRESSELNEAGFDSLPVKDFVFHNNENFELCHAGTGNVLGDPGTFAYEFGGASFGELAPVLVSCRKGWFQK